MDDRFTETTTVSYWENIKNSFFSALFGIVFIIAAFCLLWWNEGNFAALIQKESYIKKNAVAVNSDILEKSNNSKLIFTNGRVYTSGALSDSYISINKALKLKRNVEMYQWVESKSRRDHKNKGGSVTKTTTYYYRKKWDSEEHDSSKFKKQEYKNPSFTIKSETLTANSASMGAFELNKSQIDLMKSCKTINNLPKIDGYKIAGNYYYKGKDISNPEIGDIRISYQFVPSGSAISVVGRQDNNTIVEMPYKKGGIYVQYDGLLTLEQMNEKYKEDNRTTTIIIRIVGIIMMFIGLCALTEPLIAISGYFPGLSHVLEGLTKFLMFLVALVLSILTISIAWLVYRPLLSISLIILAGAIVYYVKKHIHKKKAEHPTAQ